MLAIIEAGRRPCKAAGAAAILLGVKGFISGLSLVSVFLACPPPAVRATEAPAAPVQPGAASPSEALYQFSTAKLLAVEGSVPEALEAFEEAEGLAPAAFYIRVEHAQLLARAGEISRVPATRQDYLRRAAAKIEEARRLAPENLDVLRAAGSIYLDLSLVDPTAQATAITALEAVRRAAPSDVPASLSLGQLYLEHRQPAQAVQVLRDLISRVPQQRVAYALLIEALLRSERGREAEDTLGEILGFDPASLESRLTLADLQAQRGDHEAALATLRAAPAEVVDDPRLRRKLAWELYAAGDLEGARTTVDDLLTQAAGSADPEMPSMQLVKGLVLAAEGHSGEALGLLQGLHAAQPANAPLAATVARLLVRDGRRDEGVEVLRRLAADLGRQGRAAQEREVLLDLAQVQLTAGDVAGVEATVAPLLDSPDAAARQQALLLRTDALLQAKRYDEALAVLPAGGASPEAEGRRAEVLYRSGRESEARTALAALATRGETRAAIAAAQVWQRLERYEDSIPVLEKVVADHPETAVAWFLLGAAAERSGRREKAVAALRRTLELQPDFQAALNYLGYTYAEAGENLEEALRLVRRAVALDPENGSYVDSLGWTYHRLGRHEQARGYLERAARLEPTDATLYEHLGDVYVALGQNDRARDAYRRALELGADNAEKVRRKLSDLDRSPKKRG
ncbi:MAG TPA: hypothetical protein DD490_19720 [Acidobacteria bacterium]|nr:hypothetical protein [Acidobacteriota bacterium]